MKKSNLLKLLLVCNISLLVQIFAQFPKNSFQSKVAWRNASYISKRQKVGDIVELNFSGMLNNGFYMYATDFDCNEGPVPISVDMEGSGFEKVGNLFSHESKPKTIEEFNCVANVFTNEVHLTQKVKITESNPVIAFTLHYLTCSDETCVPGKYASTITIKTADLATGHPQQPNLASQMPEASVAEAKIEASVNSQEVSNANNSAIELPCEPIQSAAESSDSKCDLVWYFLASFLAGLATVFMPCIFPLLPMTISYFSKGQMSKTESFKKAGMYGLSIVIIYTAIAILPSMLMGSERVNNWLSTHWMPNAIFFVVFILFGMSFLGAFEITLPNSWTNKADREADKGGYYGLFFMALTLTLVSFSCTAPFLSSILILSANGGLSYKPLLGMLCYSSGFALPFVLLALAPKLLINLPKSGTWMNVMKVTFGILEMGLALKFLSNIDLVYGWNILDRTTFLGIWVALALLLTLYLLGVYKMSHDGDQSVKLSVGRFILAAFTLFASIYFAAGMLGKPVTALSGLVPPLKSKSVHQLCGKPKYADKLHIPHNLGGYFDMDQAIACAKEQNKKVLIDFTGHGCANCRKMEDKVWIDPQVQMSITDKYVIASLYVDDKTELPSKEWVSLADGTVLKTLGEKNLYYENEAFCEVSQPLYVVYDPLTNKTLRKLAYSDSKNEFLNFLSID